MGPLVKKGWRRNAPLQGLCGFLLVSRSVAFVDLGCCCLTSLILQRLSIITKARASIDNSQFCECNSFVRSKSGKSGELQEASRHILSKIDPLRVEGRQKFSTLQFGPLLSIVTNTNDVLTNVAFMFAMILPRHQYQS